MKKLVFIDITGVAHTKVRSNVTEGGLSIKMKLSYVSSCIRNICQAKRVNEISSVVSETNSDIKTEFYCIYTSDLLSCSTTVQTFHLLLQKFRIKILRVLFVVGYCNFFHFVK